MIKFPACPLRITALASCLLVAPFQASAQERVDLGDYSVKIINKIIHALPSSRDLQAAFHPDPKRPLKEQTAQKDKVLRAFSEALGLQPDKGEKLSFLSENKTPLTGAITYRMQQRYKNIPVWGERITLTASKKQQPQRISGHALHHLSKNNFPVTAKISPQHALQIGRKRSGLRAKKKQARQTLSKIPSLGSSLSDMLQQEDRAKKVIYYDEKTRKSHLAYEVSLFGIVKNRTVKPVYMIDAQSGTVLFEYNNLQHQDAQNGLEALQASGPGGNLKTGCYQYGKRGTPSLQIKKNRQGLCFLQSKDVTTWDCGHQKDYKKCKIHSFPCKSLRIVNQGRKINGGCAPLNDVHFFTQMVFDMYRDWYQIRPLKKHLNAIAHYDNKLDNAFWNGRFVHFGDGRNTFYPTIGLDIAAHEIGHGFTEQHSNLIYKGQSGGLNEAFSDMAGEAAEAYFKENYQNSEDLVVSAVVPPAPHKTRVIQRKSQGRTRQALNDLNSIIGGGASSFDDSRRTEEGITAGGASQINALLNPYNTSPSEVSQDGKRTEKFTLSRPTDIPHSRRKTAHYSPKSLFRRSLPDWKVGSDIFKAPGKALRYLDKPSRDGKSVENATQYVEGMDVHHSSGIFNKAFYLLAHKPNWTVRRAFAVFLVANHNWTPRENFRSAALKAVQASKDLNYNVEDVRDVFRQVKVAGF